MMSNPPTDMAQAKCAVCQARLPGAANFCPACGAAVSDLGARVQPNRNLTALLAGLGIAAIVGAVLVSVMIEKEPSVVPSPSGIPVDLSTMTPREAADRLFNRVMTAEEGGDRAQAQHFAPMAVAAYARVDQLDSDAYFHLGLLHLVQGDVEAVHEEIARLRQSSPNDLLADVLAHKLAQQVGDAQGAVEAAQRLAAAYDSEIETGRPDYEAHRVTIDKIRALAQ